LAVGDGVTLIARNLARFVAAGCEHEADDEDRDHRGPFAKSPNGDAGGPGNGVCRHNRCEPLVLSSVRFFGNWPARAEVK
jgi:hypothetical protein